MHYNLKTEKSIGKLNSIQGLRFIAFLLVFLNHSFGYLGIGKIFDFGARGVEIFFILSGYLVAFNYSDKNIDSSIKGAIEYCYKKIKKFYWLHIITFILFWAKPFQNYLKGTFSENEIHVFWMNTVLNVTLLKSWYFPSAFSFNGVTWFLSTIIFSYLLAPKIINILRNKSKYFYITAFFCLLIIKMILDTIGYRMPHDFHAFSLYTNPLYRFQDFLLGYVFYMCVHDRSRGIYSSVPKIIQVFIVVTYFISCFVFDKLWLPASFILLGLMMVYIVSIPQNVFSGLLGNYCMTLLGNISFELFILHIFIIKCTSKIFGYLKITGHGILLWITSLVFSILVSYIVYKKPWKKFVL